MSPSERALDTLWEWHDPAESERRFRERLAGQTGSAAAETRTQLARALCLQRRFADSHAELDLAEAAAPGLSERVRARLHLERGRLLRDELRSDEAHEQFDAAWSLARSAAEDFLAVDAGHMLALSHEDLDTATGWLERSYGIADASHDPRTRAWRYSLAINHADRLHEAGRSESALPWIDRAEAAALEAQRPRAVRMARCARARAWRELGRHAQALELARRLLTEAEPAERTVQFIHEELGRALLAQGAAEDATAHLQRAVELMEADPWTGPTQRETIERLRELAASASESLRPDDR